MKCLNQLFKKQKFVIKIEHCIKIKKFGHHQKIISPNQEKDKIFSHHFMVFLPAIRKTLKLKIKIHILVSFFLIQEIVTKKMVCFINSLFKWVSFLLSEQMYHYLVKLLTQIITCLVILKTHGTKKDHVEAVVVVKVD